MNKLGLGVAAVAAAPTGEAVTVYGGRGGEEGTA